jgi:hypothetical protein
VARVVGWIEEEINTFYEEMGTKGKYCAMIGSRDASSVLEKVECSHIKIIGGQTSPYQWMI